MLAIEKGNFKRTRLGEVHVINFGYFKYYWDFKGKISSRQYGSRPIGNVWDGDIHL